MRKFFKAGLLLAGLLVMLTGCAKGNSGQAEVEVSDILAKIKEAYGENYLPDTELDEAMLGQMFNLDLSLVEAYAAEMPMISNHPDRVVIVKAKEGKGREVEEQLKAARKVLVEDSFQYPANMPKVESSQVVREGDYVGFLLVGAVNENWDASEEEQLTFAQEETQKAVDAFQSFF